MFPLARRIWSVRFLSWNFNCPKHLRTKFFLSEIASLSELSKNLLGNYLLSDNSSWRFWLPRIKQLILSPFETSQELLFLHCEPYRPRFSYENQRVHSLIWSTSKTYGELPSTEQISTKTCRWVPLECRLYPKIQLNWSQLSVPQRDPGLIQNSGAP